MMELYDNTFIGYIPEYSDANERNKHTSIYVVGMIDDKNVFVPIDNETAVKWFPPKGKVFAPKFFNRQDKSWCKKFISFAVWETNDPQENHDKYVVNYDQQQPALFGSLVYNLPEFPFEGINRIPFQRLAEIFDNNNINLEEDFYILSQNMLFRCPFKTGKIDTIEYWKINLDFINQNANHFFKIECKDNTLYTVLPPIVGDPIQIDTINEAELNEWFVKILKKRYPSIISKVINKQEWKESLLELSINPKLSADITKNRLDFIFQNLENLGNQISILDTIKDDERFKNLIIEAVSYLKENYIQEIYRKNEDKFLQIENENIRKIEEYEKSVQSAIDRIKIDITKSEIEKSDISLEIEKLKTKVKNYKEQIEKQEHVILNLKENKDRIIRDFGIIKEVLFDADNGVNNNLPIEKVQPSGIAFNTRNQLVSITEYYLNKYKQNKKIGKRLVDRFSYYDVLLVENVRVAISIVKGLNNTYYSIQNVGIDWKDFGSLWNNGLAKLWQSAHSSPDIMHVMILEGMNMSYIPCYLSPIVDYINGVRTIIPYANSPFPKNLRIIGTMLHPGNTDVGLPVYEDDINSLGCLEHLDESYNPDDIVVAYEKGYTSYDLIVQIREDVKYELVPLKYQDYVSE